MAHPDRHDNLQYPSKRELLHMETVQAFGLAMQAILGACPDYPQEKIHAALGHAKSPDAISRAIRHSFPFHMFSAGIHRNDRPHRAR